MIHKIYSSDPAFKTLELKAGFNVLIADKTQRSTTRQTRNGAGKSSLVRIVHFLLGGSCDKGRCMFLDEALRPYTFGMVFDLAGERIAVERSANTASRVFFPEGRFANWPMQPRRRKSEDAPSLRNEDWKAVLGTVMFKLRFASDEERAEKFIPTLRGLFPYFARLHEEGGFHQPYSWFSKQLLWQQQVGIAFLLGLDWRIPQGMQVIRTRQRTIKQLQQVIEESGGIPGILPRSDDLEAQLTIAAEQTRRVKTNLASYTINPEYHELEAEANRLTAEISGLLDEDVWDREVVSNIEHALQVEAPPDPADLRKLYEEAQIELPESATRRFEEVRAFHESVLRNRRSYLNGELSDARKRLSQREAKRAQLDTRRSQVMALLTSTGALDQFTQLQSELGRLEGRTESLRRQATAAREIEDTRLQLDIESKELELRLGRNHEEQAERIREAQIKFAQYSELLFETPGALVVSNKLSGPPVKVRIEKQDSAGITLMQIFCFDMTMFWIARRQGIGPDFIIHDSHLFDGVDARQASHALRAAINSSKKESFQYLVTLNSDKVQTIKEAGLDLAPYALNVRLTDQSTGGLFGKQFG